MKVLIIYDSVYGNTEKITRAIAGALGEDARLLRASEASPSQLGGVELLIIGSPTQGGRATPPVQDFLKSIPDRALKNVRTAVFDTRVQARGKNLAARALLGTVGYAAGRMAQTLKAKGGELAAPPEGFYVKGTKGPLEDGEETRAAEWAGSLLTRDNG